jgi:hypothetical protein
MMTTRTLNKAGMALVFGAMIFVPRLADLDRFINIDACLHWLWRSTSFWDHLAAGSPWGTYLSDHPGVTIMLTTGASLRLGALLKFGAADPWNHFRELMFFAKLPVALITGVGLVSVWATIRRFGGDRRFAILALFFLAVDPYFLAHSRYLHLDAVNAVFMLCCLLTVTVYLLQGRARWLVVSGVLLGLGLLTRSSSFALVPWVAGLLLMSKTRLGLPGLARGLRDVGAWLGVGAIVFVALWPVMWVAPAYTLKSVAGGVARASVNPQQAVGQVTTGEEEKPLVDTHVYESIVIYRSGTVVLFGVAGLVVLLRRFAMRRIGKIEALVACPMGFGIFFLAGMSLFAKVSPRYVLVSYIAIQLVAAYGLYVTAKAVIERASRPGGRRAAVAVVLALCAWSSFEVFRLHPYYGSFSGLRAQRGYGWGEGLEQVAAHLNAKDHPERLVVASFYPCVLSRYFAGTTLELDAARNGDPEVDYVVLYDSQVNRGLYPEVIRRYHSGGAVEPEFAAVINGVEYAWLYGARSPAQSPAPVYPPSSFITGITFDMSTLEERAEYSDNWPVTWCSYPGHPDGVQYTSWGDGPGFAASGRVSMGVARIEGGKDDYTGINVNGSGAANTDWPDETGKGGKSLGLICLDLSDRGGGETIYIFRSGTGSDHGALRQTELWKSTDRGESFGFTGVRWETDVSNENDPEGFFSPSFLQFGKDYTGVPAELGDYIYAYAPEVQSAHPWDHDHADDYDWQVQHPGEITLMRVRRDQIEDRSRWEYFAGVQGNDPLWSSTFERRRPVFADAANGVMRTSVSYNDRIGRYLLTTQQVCRHSAASDEHCGNHHMGIYEAEKPWGPWRTVLFHALNDNLPGSSSRLNEGSKSVFWNFSNKWLHDPGWDPNDGLNFVMVYTGAGEDNWGSVEGRFTVCDGCTDSTPLESPAGNPVSRTAAAGAGRP